MLCYSASACSEHSCEMGAPKIWGVNGGEGGCYVPVWFKFEPRRRFWAADFVVCRLSFCVVAISL